MTKTIAAKTGISVAAINEAARDLGIATYRADRRSWVVADHHVEALVEHVTEDRA